MNFSISRAILAVLPLALVAVPASAQSVYPTPLGRTTAPATVPLQCNASNAACAPITAANPQPVLPMGVASSGSIGALNANQALTLNGAAGFAVDIRGTFTGTVTFQGTVDGTNWATTNVLPVTASVNTALTPTATAAGAWLGNAAGLLQVRAIFTAYTSGSATVTLRATNAHAVSFNQPVGSANQLVSLAAGTLLAADVGFQYRANNTGAATAVSILSPATPAGALMKSGAGRLIGCFLTNTAAALRSVKFYNATAVTMGTTAAAFEIDLPQNAYGTFNLPGGIGFATGIMTATTSAKGLTDNTATGLVANDVSGTCWFL